MNLFCLIQIGSASSCAKMECIAITLGYLLNLSLETSSGTSNKSSFERVAPNLGSPVRREGCSEPTSSLENRRGQRALIHATAGTAATTPKHRISPGPLAFRNECGRHEAAGISSNMRDRIHWGTCSGWCGNISRCVLGSVRSK